MCAKSNEQNENNCLLSPWSTLPRMMSLPYLNPHSFCKGVSAVNKAFTLVKHHPYLMLEKETSIRQTWYPQRTPTTPSQGHPKGQTSFCSISFLVSNSLTIQRTRYTSDRTVGARHRNWLTLLVLFSRSSPYPVLSFSASLSHTKCWSQPLNSIKFFADFPLHNIYVNVFCCVVKYI
jgi:hypothetical protein